MKFFSKQFLTLVLVTMAGLNTVAAFAACTKTVNGAKSPFAGDSLSGLAVDKDSLSTINKDFPNLHVTEEVLSGNLQTCSGGDCKDNFVTCK
jgi:hypothetical protein